MSTLRPAIVTFAALTFITGLAYPLVMTGVGQALLHKKANGSLIIHDGQVRGSSLIGRATEESRYFWGRISATGDFPTNAMASGGSNLAPSNPDLRKAAEARIQALHDVDPGNTAPIPEDLVTASGSGLDPHISPAAAEYQLARIARVRGLNPVTLSGLIQRHTQSGGFLSVPRVNVLELNLDLDRSAH
jgi:K+-transporting ATPase ATPase C chain